MKTESGMECAILSSKSIKGFGLCLAALLGSCAQEPQGFHTPESRYASNHSHKIVFVDGVVYLTTANSNGELIGPFEQGASGGFTHEDPPGYFHQISPGDGEDWTYSWDYLHMRSQPVDASELALAKAALDG